MRCKVVRVYLIPRGNLNQSQKSEVEALKTIPVAGATLEKRGMSSDTTLLLFYPLSNIRDSLWDLAGLAHWSLGQENTV